MSHDETTRSYRNFREANDTPAALLKSQAASLFKAADVAHRDGDQVLAHSLYSRAESYDVAATFLMAQEMQKEVTFVALDNDTLDAVISNHRHGDLYDVVDHVVDLLGLED